MKYYITKKITADFNTAIQKVTDELSKNGFGIITEIDMQQKLKEKLDVDFKKYKILGACNPAFAYEALQQEDKIGTMLPCNVIVQEHSENNVEVSAIDPVASMMALESKEVEALAQLVKDKLQLVIDSL